MTREKKKNEHAVEERTRNEERYEEGKHERRKRKAEERK